MNHSADDISHLIFRRAEATETGQFALDGKMLKLLMELNGRNDIKSVGVKLGINTNQLNDMINKLLSLRLIEPLKEKMPVLERTILNAVKMQLTYATGPIAEFLIEETLKAMDVSHDHVPRHRASELIELLARQIPRTEKRIQFQMSMGMWLDRMRA